MGATTGIEWTDATWSPVIGCTHISAGCKNCWAPRSAVRFSAPGKKYAGLTVATKRGPKWNGHVAFVAKDLDQPLRWREPRKIFVVDMGDLFHEDVPDAWIDRVFAVMALAPRHTFQVLTKRPERMLRWFTETANGATREALVAADMDQPRWATLPRGQTFPRYPAGWPLPNVHVGVSVENQATVAHILLLLQTPAAVRWISYEPSLGPIDLDPYFYLTGPSTAGPWEDALGRHRGGGGVGGQAWSRRPSRDIAWLVAGGESGHGARPPHPDWFRSARDQCVAAGVRYFFKQWGEYAPVPKRENGPGRMVRAGDVIVTLDGRRAPIERDLSCTLEGDGIPMRRVGKTEAGRVLDGRTWEQYPDDPADPMF